MIALPTYVLWIGATLLAGYVAALNWRLGLLRSFPFLSLYLILYVLVGLSRFLVLTRMGYASEHYMLLYHHSNAVLAILLYVVIVELYRRILPAEHWKLQRRCSLALLFLVVLCSLAAVWPLDIQIVMAFAYTLSQNWFMISFGLTLLLWIVVLLRDLPRGIAFRMVQVWGVYLLLLARMYFLDDYYRRLPPSALQLYGVVPQMAEAWLPLGLGFVIVSGSGQDPSPKL